MYSPELTKAETEYCSSNIYHKWHVHPKVMVSTSFVFSILIGAGFTWISLAPCDVAFILTVFALLGLLTYLVSWPFPCNCGFLPLLSSEMRRSFAQGEPNLLMRTVCEGKVVLHSTPCGFWMLNLFLFVVLLVCGELAPRNLQCLFTLTPAFICLPINMIAWRKIAQIRAISSAEIDRNTASDGRTTEELKEQIALFLYIGNFERADICSQNLLSLAEQDLKK